MNTADSRQTKAQLVAELTILRAHLDKLGQRPGGDKRKNHLLRLFIDAMPHFGFAIDAGGRFRQVLTGEQNLAARVLEGQLIREVLPADDAKLLQGAVSKTLKTGQAQNFEFIMTVLAGRRWFEVHTTVIKSDAEEGKLAVCLFQDITNLKLAEGVLSYAQVELGRKDEELHAVERRRTAILDTFPHGIAEVDNNGVITYGNPAYHAMFGKPDKELIGTSIFDRAESKKAREFLKSQFPRLVTEQPPPAPYFMNTRAGNGGARELQVDWNYKRNAEGELLGFIAVLTDITQLKEAEQELKESRELLQTVIDTVPHAIFAKDRQGKFRLANRAFASMHGLEPERLLGFPAENLPNGTEEEKKQFAAHDRRVWRTGKAVDVAEVAITPAGGDTEIHHVHKLPIHDGKGKITGLVGISEDITERKKAEEALKRSEGMMARAQEVAQIGSLEWDIASGRQIWSDEVFRILGHKPQAFEPDAMSFADTLHPEDKKAVLMAMNDAVWNGKPFDVTCRIVRPDGTERILHGLSEVSRDEAGEPLQMIGTVHDITERKRTERELHASQRLLQTVFDSNPHAIFVRDREGRYLMVNETLAERYGLSPKEFEGKHLSDIVAGMSVEREWRTYLQSDQDVIRTGQRTSLQDRTLDFPNGEQRTVHTIKSPLRDEAGEVVGVVGVSEDITERVRTERELQASRQLLQTVFDANPHAIYVRDREGRYLMVNQTMAERYHMAAEDFVGRHVSEVLSHVQKDWEAFLQTDRYVVDTGKRLTLENRLHRLKDGSHRIIHAVKSPLRGEAGEVTGVVGVSEDVTERVRTERELQASQRLLQTVFDSISHWIFVKDRESRYLKVNRAFAESYGLLPEDFVGAHTMDIGTGTEDELRRFVETDKQVMEEDRPLVLSEYSATLPDGSPRINNMTKTPLRDEEGNVAGLVGVAEDVTERKSIEEQLRQSQKMEAMGTLAGGIAHDLNNILQPILGFTGVMLQTTDPETENHGYLNQVFESAFRAKDLVSQILLFSRPRKSKTEPSDLKSIAMEVARFLRSSLPTTIAIRENYADKLSRVNGDRSQLHQIILNLGINAGQAMPDGGRLELELEDVRLRDLDTVVGTPLSGDYVRLAVSDSGVGMDDETRARIFDPFFTTRAVGTGSGLGLATVFGIVRNQEGGIVVTSSPGKGSRFEVYLPAVQRAGRESMAEDEPPATGSEHVLVVDDEEMICEVARIALESLGYRVTTVQSGTHALELFKTEPRRFDLVITDQTMPELTGERLAGELKKINPEVPVILCTGFSETISAETAASMGISRILLKPLTAEELGREVRLAMEGEPAGPAADSE